MSAIMVYKKETAIPLTSEELCWLRFRLRLDRVRKGTRRLPCGGSRLPQLFNCKRYMFDKSLIKKDDYG
jgi:hypothetical protein